MITSWARDQKTWHHMKDERRSQTTKKTVKSFEKYNSISSVACENSRPSSLLAKRDRFFRFHFWKIQFLLPECAATGESLSRQSCVDFAMIFSCHCPVVISRQRCHCSWRVSYSSELSEFGLTRPSLLPHSNVAAVNKKSNNWKPFTRR